jgi:nucleoside-diphosphate-sugar epimerase
MVMETVMVTGATGLIGSNVCAELLERDYEARALVRPGSDTAALDALGVHIVRGDVVSFADIQRAAEGCDYCIHTAALVTGGPEHSWSEYHDVNVTGTYNVFDAARDIGMKRVVSFASAPNPRTTEYPPGAYADDPYWTAKLQIAREVIRRSASGQDIVEISPGAAFGPAPTGERAVLPPGFNSRIVLALRGELPVMPAFVSSFDLASDVAHSTVNALTRGDSGERYDLGGRPEERVDTVSFFNIACERANVEWRVRAMTAEELDSDEAAERFGPSIMLLARSFLTSSSEAVPQLSPGRILARDVLGHDPVAARPAIEQTVDWMFDNGIV